MENEINIIEDNLNEKLKSDNIFQLEYWNQSLKNNIKFIKWKESLFKKYNNNLKIFRCKKDKILFYPKYKKNIFDSFKYFEECPICHEHICYFCSYSSSKTSYLICCYRRSINISLFICGPKYAKNNEFVNDTSFMYPGINILFCLIRADGIFFSDMATKKSRNEKELKSAKSGENKLYISMLYIIPILLCIPFLISNCLFIGFLYLISIPFKLLPIKYYYGIFDPKKEYFY